MAAGEKAQEEVETRGLRLDDRVGQKPKEGRLRRFGEVPPGRLSRSRERGGAGPTHLWVQEVAKSGS